MRDKKRGHEYVLRFIGSKLGVEAMAKESGMNRQTLRQLEVGRNFISLNTAKRIAEYYDDFDVNQALGYAKGENLEIAMETESVQIESNTLMELATLRAENTSLRADNKRLNEAINEFKNTIAQLQEEIRGYARDFRQLAFPETSSYSPVPPQPRQWITGLRSSLVPDFNADDVQCIVRPLWPVSKSVQLDVA